MNLSYELIEECFDDTTNIRTMSEQAKVPGEGWLVRTIVYTPHHITMAVTFVPAQEEQLYDSVVP